MYKTFLGVDPAGEGSNNSAYVVRDKFKAQIVGSEAKSSDVSTAERVLTTMHKYKVPDHRTTIDNFGAGANIAREVAIADEAHYRVNAVNVGRPPSDKRVYLNKRAENFFRLKTWVTQWRRSRQR